MANVTFQELSLTPEIFKVIEEMGFATASDIQAQAIPVIRTGADILARSQTGTGKTLAFGIPAVECIDPALHCPQVLVLSPTRELAHQCGEQLRKLAKYLPGVKATDILGGGDYRDQFRELHSANLIIGTPGRIMDHLRRGTLSLAQLNMVVLDEADEMLNMGFREDIEVILQGVPEQRQILLFSATLPKEILGIAQQFQKDPVRIEVNRDQVTLENIHQRFVEVPSAQKSAALTLLLHYYRPCHTIIFANTKLMVDELSNHLISAGFSAEGLHGDMKQLQRTSVMNGFRKGRVSILVATDVAARGIDVSDLDYVINYDIPTESDLYVHRIGRTGRAGRAGTALTLCCGRNQVLHLQRLSQWTKSAITPVNMPTVADIEAANQARTAARIEQAMQSASPESVHSEMIETLMRKGYDPARIAAALLDMYFQQDTTDLKDVPAVQSDSRATVQEHCGMADMVVSIGSANRVTERHLVGAITERSGLSSRNIGKIKISQAFSTIGVPADRMNEILQAMQGCKICGKPVSFVPLTDQRPVRRKAAVRSDARPRYAAGRAAYVKKSKKPCAEKSFSR